MILPTTEYEVPLWLQQVFHHRFNKMIDGLTGVAITLAHARHQYTKSQDASDDEYNRKMMVSTFDHLNEIIQQLATYASRQRYNIVSIDIGPSTLDNCDMDEIITKTHLPLICSTAIEWCDTPNLPVQAPKTYLQAVLTNLIDACQQVCLNASSGDVKLWMEQTAQFNQLYLQCSTEVNFNSNKDVHANDVSLICFYLSLKACERLLVAINGKIEIHPHNNQLGVIVILSFSRGTETIENKNQA